MKVLNGLVGLVVGALVLQGCAGQDTTPEGRVVSLTTTACGATSRTSGAGVIVEDGWVLASGHVVSGAGSVEVSGPFGTEMADIVVFDAVGDLSLLRVPSARSSAIESAAANTGDLVELAGGGPSGAIETAISRPVEVRIEAVRSDERIGRIGYEIDTRVQLGDSGGGVFDDDGRLIGIVFGRPSTDEDRSYIVGAGHVTEVLSAERSGQWTCSSTEHRIVPTDSSNSDEGTAQISDEGTAQISDEGTAQISDEGAG